MSTNTTIQQRYWLECGIPWRVLEATLENYQTPTPKHESARKAAENFSRQGGAVFLLFSGPSGTGKSHLASAVLKSFGSGIYITVAELVELSHSTYASDSPITRLQLRSTVESCECLVLDEVGKSTGSGSEMALRDTIIAFRHDRGLPTVLISNVPLDRMASEFGDAMTDRIRESCIVVPPVELSFRGVNPSFDRGPLIRFNGLIPKKPGTSDEERFQKFLSEYDEGVWVGRYNEMRFAPDFIKTAFHEKEKQTTPE